MHFVGNFAHANDNLGTVAAAPQLIGIMVKATQYAQTSALPAIAAALALLSTPALAQQAQPVPDISAAPPVALDTSPAPTNSDSGVATSTDSSTSAVTAKPRTARAAPKRAVAAAKAAPKKVTASKVTVSSATRSAHVSATKVAAPPKAAPPAAPAPAAAPAVSRRPAPIVDMTAKPSTPAPAPAAARSSNPDERTLELGGGALALLALGGAAFAVSRRRRRMNEEEWYGDEAAAGQYVEPTVQQRDPVVARPAAAEPRILAPAVSAFAWGSGEKRETTAGAQGNDRRPGETWAERAYRGPTPDNPSLSLKKRLKRAAFFDKRERDAAEGRVAPVDPSAGLPESSAATQKELVAA